LAGGPGSCVGKPCRGRDGLSETSDRTTVIKKEDELGNRSKTAIHHGND
jgi:hypothetical protein